MLLKASEEDKKVHHAILKGLGKVLGIVALGATGLGALGAGVGLALGAFGISMGIPVVGSALVTAGSSGWGIYKLFKSFSKLTDLPPKNQINGPENAHEPPKQININKSIDITQNIEINMDNGVKTDKKQETIHKAKEKEEQNQKKEENEDEFYEVFENNDEINENLNIDNIIKERKEKNKKLENKINNTESAIDAIHTKFGNGESLFNEMISEGYLRVHSADKPNMKSNETNIGKDGTK